jgi:hypothetical protein
VMAVEDVEVDLVVGHGEKYERSPCQGEPCERSEL